MRSEGTTGYSAVQISLHWLIVVLVLFQIVFGDAMGEAREGLERGRGIDASTAFLAGAHYWTGLAILALAAIRLAMRLSIGAPAPVPGNPLFQRLGEAAHWAFYGLLFAAPITGLLAVYVNAEIGEVHELVKPAFVILIALHAGAALYHHFVLRDDTLRRMLVPARRR